jgi:hypothetical protein
VERHIAKERDILSLPTGFEHVNVLSSAEEVLLQLNTLWTTVFPTLRATPDKPTAFSDAVVLLLSLAVGENCDGVCSSPFTREYQRLTSSPE